MYDTDSYNDSHYLMYPDNTQSISGYMEPRSNSIFNRVMFFGLQYYIKEYLLDIEDQMTQKNVLKAERAWNAHGLPFNRTAWEALRDDLDCKLPVEIQAVAEGSWVHKDNVVIQMQSTDEQFFWLPTWLETTLVQNWFPCTVATSDKDLKLVIEDYLIKTGCENIDAVLPFMVHDFGFRGASSYETACIGGAAHLVNFMGSDTFPAILFINEYYSKLADSERMWGYSIPASNHAVITAWGKPKEFDAYQHIINTFLKEGKLVACVSDSYDFWAAIDAWGTQFRAQIIKSGGRLVVRPDSGDPVDISVQALLKLMGYFGYTLTKTGFKLLPNCIRLIWGDGTNPAIIERVLRAMADNGLAAENIVFGMGAALLQKVDRDMCIFAFKINEEIVNGKCMAVNKNPVTGRGKASKPHRLALVIRDGRYVTIPEAELGNEENQLLTVFKNGELLIDWDFEEIRERAKIK